MKNVTFEFSSLSVDRKRNANRLRIVEIYLLNHSEYRQDYPSDNTLRNERPPTLVLFK